MSKKAVFSLFLIVPWIALAAAPVAAGIHCRNGYQIVNGALIATPYCQDELVFKVAREYGLKTTAAEIRNNPNHKRHLCRFVGRDIRVQLACTDANSAGRRAN